MKKFFHIFIKHFTDTRIPMSSAALSYYLTMTFFPVIICVYFLLGRNIGVIETVLNFMYSFMPDDTVEYLSRFLIYVDNNYNLLMFFLAASVVLISASAGFRSIENTIGRMQGGLRYYGYTYFLFSILLSIVFVFVVYVGIAIMFLSKNFISFLNRITPELEFERSWLYLRFVVLFGIAFFVIWIIFIICKRKEDKYHTFLGAFISTVLLTAISFFFSKIISNAIKYPLVYGSLASIILLMFWLYAISMCIYLGAVINVSLRDYKLLKSNYDGYDDVEEKINDK